MADTLCASIAGNLRITDNAVGSHYILALFKITYSGFFKYEVRSTWGHSLKQGA